jgi:dienelactone hydrolase
MRRAFVPLFVLASAFAPAQAPTWDQLKAVYDVQPMNMDIVKTQDRSAAEGTYTEFNFPSENGDTAYGTFVRPNAKGPFPLVVLIHGVGDSEKSMIDSFAKDFLKQGFAVLAIDAPHNGQRATAQDKKDLQGTFMRFAMSKDQAQGLGEFMFHDDPTHNTKFATDAIEGGVRDIRRALDWVKMPEHRVDSTKIGVMGISMGSMMASILSAVDTRINAAMLVIGGDPIAPFLGQVPADQLLIDSAASPSLFLGHSTAHVLMLNGYNDTVMPRGDQMRLFESAPGVTYMLFDTPGGLANGFGHSIPAEGYAYGEAWLTKMISVAKPATREHAKPLGGG